MKHIEPDPPLTVRFYDSTSKTFRGRYAWALRRLIRAGEQGCAPIDWPDLGWPHYVEALRGEGVRIDTVMERHRGQNPGTHVRYVLRSDVAIVEQRAA